MPREKETYRLHLEWLNEQCPNKKILTAKDVADLLHIDWRTAKRRYGIDRNGITIVKLASQLS